MSTNPFTNGSVAVHSYTRAQALSDGTLMDASGPARMVGFKLPVGVTAAVWADCVLWDPYAEVVPQNVVQRLWDLLSAARQAMDGAPEANLLHYELARIPPGGTQPEQVELTVHTGSGDNGEPVITIMQPGEC